jgi:hypothetical protein
VIGQIKQFLFLGTVVWQQSNIVYNTDYFVSKHRLVNKEFCAVQKKSIFCMQYVCDVHHKCVVAHAYNMVTKIQSSSGWAFWCVLRSLRLAQDFGNVLASICCAGSCSGLATIFQSHPTLKLRIKECVSSFPLYQYAIHLTSSQNSRWQQWSS